jgi:chromosome segregation ATPase
VTGGSPTVELLRELVRADEAHSAALEQLDSVALEAAALGARAEELASVLATAPAERERLALALQDATRDANRRELALGEAEAELAEAERHHDRERLAAARRFQVRAADALAMARKHVGGCEAEIEDLERRVEAAERETPELESRAERTADTLRVLPRVAADAGRLPGRGLAGVSEWATAARAALLVARSGVGSEREAVIRQANELGAAILGEPVVAASAALVARRVEDAAAAGS